MCGICVVWCGVCVCVCEHARITHMHWWCHTSDWGGINQPEKTLWVNASCSSGSSKVLHRFIRFTEEKSKM